MAFQPQPDIIEFYESQYVEDERLRRTPHGRLEFARTQELLRRFLPVAPAAVLDVGGGTGVHARWLAADGYAVRLLDPVAAHVAQAAQVPGVTAVLGDARELDVATGSVDVVLLLGPLYHLPARDDRICALTEARRVLRPDGLVIAAGISRYAGLLDYATQGRLDTAALPAIRDVIATGRHDPRLGFTTAYCHLPDELAAEVGAAGFGPVDVYGVEGPLCAALDVHGLNEVDAMLPAAIACARLVEREGPIIAASPHMLAVAARR